MPNRRSRKSSALIVLASIALVLAACGVSDPSVGDGAVMGVDPGAVSTTTEPPVTVAEAAPRTPLDTGVVVVNRGGAGIAERPGGAITATVAAGVVMPQLSRDGRFLEVMTTCNDVAWVAEDDVELTAGSKAVAPPGSVFDLSEAVVVVDPGHGGRDWGGVGQNGLSEKAVNLDIAERLRTLLLASHDVDWERGVVGTGDTVPAVGTVWLTRDRTMLDEGDIEVGLGHRATLANTTGADAYLSIHNNTVPLGPTDGPGTEVFYSVGVAGSDRLASLIHEELLLSFSRFSVAWRGRDVLGAKARTDPATGADYYGVLRRAETPSVIIEGVYISEEEEEALLAMEQFRQAYAEGMYRGLVRFLTTADTGTEINPPQPFPDDAGTVNASSCVLAEEPE